MNKRGGARSERWQLALRLPTLLQGGLRRTDLRRLVDEGYLEQRLETTRESAKRRTFKAVQHLGLKERCCFLLTARGATLVRSLLTDDGAGEPAEDTVVRAEAVRPHWSAREGVLWLGDQMVRLVAKNARSLRNVLAALEEEQWPDEGIDNPLSPTKRVSDVQRLKEVIEELNEHQFDARIKFFLNAKKTGLLWRIL